MKIGIDISQIAFVGTGVSRYVRGMVEALVALDTGNEYVLFGSSLRQRHKFNEFFAALHQNHPNVTLKTLPLPPQLLEFIWNRLHIMPVEWFIGKIDIFWSSDWTQPPLAGSQGITTIHDLSFLKYPKSFNKTILAVQKRRLTRAREECQLFLCDSEATKQDIKNLLGVEASRLHVVYPGYN